VLVFILLRTCRHARTLMKLKPSVASTPLHP
jgi:hypothetical protein